MQAWHPEAQRVPYADAGAMMDVPAKLLWHTTEGFGLPTYSGSAPHLTFQPHTGELWQHIRFDRAAKSLENASGGVETNHANAIQVELIGAAARTPLWPETDYARIARLARWIEGNCGVRRQCTVRFVPYPSSSYPRLGGPEWLRYAGHCGHQHAPENHHGDPGGFRIDLVLDADADAYRTLTWGDSGADVRALQEAVRYRAEYCGRPDHMPALDGVYGSDTRRDAAFVAYVLGIGESQADLTDRGLTAYTQNLIRNPDERNDVQKQRAVARRALHCDAAAQ